MIQLATKLVTEGFKNETDRGGMPYIFHLFRVMHNLQSYDEELNCIALLHDAVEDNVLTLTQIHVSFSKRIYDAVELLTHNPDLPHIKYISYMEYVKKLSHNLDAVRVKIADLKDNMDITRLRELTGKDLDRLTKYHIAYKFLVDVLKNKYNIY